MSPDTRKTFNDPAGFAAVVSGLILGGVVVLVLAAIVGWL